jgi:hypothetical protein
LIEITAAQEAFCSVLLEVQEEWSDFKRRPPSNGRELKTFLCAAHCPRSLSKADVLGSKVARLVCGELQFGEVVDICGFSKHTRHLDARVAELLSKDEDSWKYNVEWPGATSMMDADEIRNAAELAASILKWHGAEIADIRKKAQDDQRNAYKRGLRAGPSTQAPPGITKLRYVFPTFSGLLDALPSPFRRLLPEDGDARSHIISNFTTETSLGTIQHSGNGLIFDINTSSKATETHPVRNDFAFDVSYMRRHPGLVHDMFGFTS